MRVNVFSTGCQTTDYTGDLITDDITTATIVDVTEDSQDNQLISVIVGVAGGSVGVIFSVTVVVAMLGLLCVKSKQSREGTLLQTNFCAFLSKHSKGISLNECVYQH